MNILKITDTEEGSFKEISFIYKNMRFAYKYISTSGWDDGTLILLNKDQDKIEQSELNKIEDLLNNLDLNALDINDEIELE